MQRNNSRGVRLFKKYITAPPTNRPTLKEGLQRAREVLSDCFDYIPTLSDRMYLKRYVKESIETYWSFDYQKRQIIDPVTEAVGKFIMIHHRIRNVKRIAGAIYHRDDLELNRQLKETDTSAFEAEDEKEMTPFPR